MPLVPASESSPAEWIVDSLTTFGAGVRGLVPDRFEAYARVFHPAWLGREDGRQVTWAEIAEHNGKTAHAGMQFRSIVPDRSFDRAGNCLQNQPGLWSSPPSDGEIPDDIATELARVLADFTSTTTECYFAYWHGWGDPSTLVAVRRGLFSGLRTQLAMRRIRPSVEPGSPRAARDQASGFSTPGRGYYLYRGGVSDVVTQWQEPFGALPTMWWPADEAWFVHTEIDLDSTFVGASRACIDALLNSDGVEVWEVELSQGITWDSDHINGPPVHG